MAICTNCGNIIFESDIENHICINPVTKGKEKVITTTEKVI